MGKKGTKRKTRWRTLPLAAGEEGCTSGNEDETVDEDKSTSSSNNYRPYQPSLRMGERSYRQTRRYSFDRREPLVKLENKTFDEEEYTKITTPRQDVLFKKGYLGRKRPESSTDDNINCNGETETEPEAMEQLIITNGFVDERGHYLMNGSSYEIYDPYSNTVTVVVGPPPFSNGVTTPPVLAAVSCQPVPLHPVEWYPPNQPWSSPLSYQKRHSHDSINSPTSPNGSEDSTVPTLPTAPFPPFPGYVYGQPLYVNGVIPIEIDPISEPTEVSPNPDNSTDKRIQKRRRRRRKTDGGEEEIETSSDETEQATKNWNQTEINENTSTQYMHQTENNEDNRINEDSRTGNESYEDSRTQYKVQSKPLNELAPPFVFQPKVPIIEEVNLTNDLQEIPKKENHLQTNKVVQNGLGKESHSTQTTPEITQIEPKHRDSTPSSSPAKTPNKKYTQRRSFNTENKMANRVFDRKVPIYAPPPESPKKNLTDEDGFRIVSYAKTVMNGINSENKKQIENNRSPVKKMTNGNDKIPYGRETEVRHKKVDPTRPRREDRIERRPNIRKDKLAPRISDLEKRFSDHSDTSVEPQSNSEKSSNVSELSSPAELSSGQITPPVNEKKNGLEEKLNQINVEQKKNRKKEINGKSEKAQITDKVDNNVLKPEEITTEIEPSSQPNSIEMPENEIEIVEVISKTVKNSTKNSGKKKKKAEVIVEAQKQNKKSKKKKKDKDLEDSEDKKEREDSFLRELPSLPLTFLLPSPQDLLNNYKNAKTELDEFLSSDDDILKTIQTTEEQLNLPKVSMKPELFSMLPPFRPNNKFSFEDCFTKSMKNWHSDVFTKTNITSMRSTKPEEFFASVVDAPTSKPEIKRKSPEKTVKVEDEKVSQTVDKNAQIVVKKNVYVPPTVKLAKNLKKGEKIKEKTKTEGKKNLDENAGEKLGIVNAVSTWLQNHETPDQVLTIASLPHSDEQSDDEDNIQKNLKSNPLHALSPETSSNCQATEDKEQEVRLGYLSDNGCSRVANKKYIQSGDNFLNKVTRAKSFDFLLDKRKKKKFLKQSASYCQNLFNNVKNGINPVEDKLVFGNEEKANPLYDSKASVSKYYQLSTLDKYKSCESSDSDDVIEAIDYQFTKQDECVCGKHKLLTETIPDLMNTSITDSGVQSDSDSTDSKEQKEYCKLQ